jgi:DNA primase
MNIPKKYFDELSYKITWIEIFQKCGIKYRKNRSIHATKILCPFHDEKTPSMYVNVYSSFCHCYGCGETVDMFAFVCKVLFGRDRTKTFKWFKKQFNIPIPWEK